MGVVRREGDWRLDKQDDGIYEVTYQQRSEMKIITEDYQQRGFIDERTDFTVPVREVNSFSEAEALFEEVAQGSTSPVGGMASPIDHNSSSDTDIDLSDAEADLSDVPPAGLFVGGLIVGGFLIVESGLAITSTMFLIGGAFLLLPLGVTVLTYRVYATKGVGAAISFLLTTENGDSESSSSADSGTERTPPAPEKLKNDLYFERANRQCEWCGEEVDSPDTHHITPRGEGGPNEPRNLIVLCPNCHRKADRGMISRSKLRRAIDA
ncbi:HNH endonuclease [Natronomonas sp. EA1]|uniref:HNH endonuclease n=1 Tax=Natronomonas sp. EA1 TaxID=3421655 RepID=UPI003EBD32D8